MRTIYKLYSGVLAERVSKWTEANDVLAPAQKGFLPYDGIFEHNYILRLEQGVENSFPLG